MPAAYTFYKFKNLFGLVLSIFFILIILSVVNPVKSKVTKEVVSEVDTTGLATTALDIQYTIPDPEGTIKQAGGNFLYRLLQENPKGFLILTLIVTGILFYKGVYLKDIRGFKRSLLR